MRRIYKNTRYGLLFFERKVSKRTHLSFAERCAQELCTKQHNFILSKTFGFPKDFSRKVLWSGFGRNPQLTTNTKNAVTPRFLYCHNVLELRSKPPSLTFFRRKVSKRTHLSFGERCAKELCTKQHNFILAKAFEVPRNFSRKVSCVRVWGRSPNIQCTLKKHGVAVLFYICLICF